MKTRAWIPVAAVVVVAGLIGCNSNIIDATRGGILDMNRSAAVRVQADAEFGAMQPRTLTVGGLERTYYLYVPESLRGSAAPLVVAFHGGGQSAERFAEGVDLRGMANRYGFVLAVPEGLRESWNTGSIDPQGYAEENGIDDLAFVSALVDDVLATGAADPARIFATGVSRGGMMSYHAACNLPGRFAAVAVVAGTLASGSCAYSSGVSLLHIHGTDDERVPFNGGPGDFTARGQIWPSAYAGIQTFAAGAQCGVDWETQQVTTDTACSSVACPGSDIVEYCLVEGGGHTWPGVQTTRRQQRQNAQSSSLFNATDYIAAFFLSH
jgi:polyhydroxybutyrate depolymerase